MRQPGQTGCKRIFSEQQLEPLSGDRLLTGDTLPFTRGRGEIATPGPEAELELQFLLGRLSRIAGGYRLPEASEEIP